MPMPGCFVWGNWFDAHDTVNVLKVSAWDTSGDFTALKSGQQSLSLEQNLSQWQLTKPEGKLYKALSGRILQLLIEARKAGSTTWAQKGSMVGESPLHPLVKTSWVPTWGVYEAVTSLIWILLSSLISEITSFMQRIGVRWSVRISKVFGAEYSTFPVISSQPSSTGWELHWRHRENNFTLSLVGTRVSSAPGMIWWISLQKRCFFKSSKCANACCCCRLW